MINNCRPRPYGRWLSQSNRFPDCSSGRLSNHSSIVGAASVAPPPSSSRLSSSPSSSSPSSSTLHYYSSCSLFSIPSLSSSINREYHHHYIYDSNLGYTGRSSNHRHFSFKNVIAQTQHLNERKEEIEQDSGKEEGARGRVGGMEDYQRGHRRERTNRHQQQPNNNRHSRDVVNRNKQQHQQHQQQQQQKRRPNRNNQSGSRHHSVRLIGESAARHTTNLFLEAYNRSNNHITNSNDDTGIATNHKNTTTATHDVFWKDAATLLAAEQALEFWAHRNNNNSKHHHGRNTKRHHSKNQYTKQNNQSTILEDDAEMAYRLFTALHYFHHVQDDNDNGRSHRRQVGGRVGGVLTNGMYSHVIDALAKSTNIHHVYKADALLRQFIHLYIVHHHHHHQHRHHRDSNDNDANEGTLQKLLELVQQGPSPHHLPTNLNQPMMSTFVVPSTPLTLPTDTNNNNNIQWNKTDTHHFPNQVRITGVMRGYARQFHPQNAESLLDLMINLSMTTSTTTTNTTSRNTPGNDKGKFRFVFRPNEVAFATVIDAHSRMCDGVNASRALGRMKSRSFPTGEASCDDDNNSKAAIEEEVGLPVVNGANVVAYNAAISAWARSAKNPSVAASTGEGGGAASVTTTRRAEEDVVVSASRAAADEAEKLLREMWRGHEVWSKRSPRRRDVRNLVLPDVVTYSTVISAHASCLDQPYGVERARELLGELEGLAVREYDEVRGKRNAEETSGTATTTTNFRGGGRNSNGFQPNTTVYNTLLQAYANVGDAPTAERVLRSMMSLHSASVRDGGGGPYRHVRPNTRTFNAVLNAWSKRGGREGGRRASEILDRMEEMGASSDNYGDDGLARPDVISYNTVLAAWSKSAGVGPSSSEGEGEGVGNNSSVVGKSAAFRALKLLDTIEQRYMQSHHSRKDMLAKAASTTTSAYDNNHTSRVVKPDTVSYNTTISAFANAAQTCENGVSMAEEAEAILSRMKDRRLGIEPDAYSYNGVLSAWARSSGGLPAARRAESILRSMRDPTIVSWSTVVNAYAHADGATKAEGLLREMEQNANNNSFERSKNGSRAQPIAPSTVLYNNVLHAWGKSSDGDASKNAMDLLDRMENTTSKLPKPDVISYQLVLTALQHGRDPDKAERAKSVLDRLLASVQRRDIRAGHRDIRNAYNCVLTSCAYTPADAGQQHRNGAARILVETLRDMNRFPSSNDGEVSDGPNQESYALFMQGCIHLFEPDSEEQNMLLKAAFHECCRKGLLNSIIWDKFRNAVRPELMRTFIKEISPGSEIGLQYENLPEEWSCTGRH